MSDAREDPEPPAALCSLRLLGPLEVLRGGRPVPLGGAKQRALLALLLLEVNHVVSCDRLIWELWGGRPPQGAATTLRTYVTHVRKCLDGGTELGAATLRSQAPGYVLTARPEEVDFLRFQRLAKDGRTALEQGAAARASAVLEVALSLWRGPVLADLGTASFAQAHIAQFEERRLVAIEDKLDAELALGRSAAVAAELEQLIHEHPLRERFCCQAMLALYRSGRQADALAVYQRMRDVLRDELGIDPTPSAQRLHRAILSQAADLDEEESGATSAAQASTPATGPAPPGLPTALPAALAAGPAAVFVGRAPELGVLSSAWNRAGAGDRRLVVVSGAAGIGKTTLAACFAATVHEARGSVMFGRCEEEAVIPYEAFSEALRDYLSGEAPEDVRRCLEVRRADLSRLLPTLDVAASGSGTPRSEGAEADRYRMFEAVVALMRSASLTAPVLLVLDNLHWADPSTLLLLRHLLHRSDGCRLLVLALHRDGEPSGTNAVPEFLADVAGAEGTDLITLEGLPETEIGHLLELTTQRRAEGGFVRALADHTDGNPYFLREVVAHLRESEGALTSAGLARAGLPAGVKAMIRRRVRRLTDSAAGVLTAGSVMGREFDGLVVTQVLDRTVDDVADAADEAVRALLAHEIPGSTGRYAFAHALVQETLYADLSALRRSWLHLRVAQVLELVRARAEVARLPEIARHYLAAGELDTAGKACHYSIRAGDQALVALAYAEAVAHYERALGAMDQFGDVDPTSRCDLLLALADAQSRAGDTAAALGRFEEAALYAARCGLARHGARAALGFGTEYAFGSVNARLIELLEQALTGLGPRDAALQALVLSRLAGALYWTSPGEWRQVQTTKRELCARAVAVARGLDDQETLVEVLHNTCFALWSSDNLEERIRLAAEIVTLAQAVHNLTIETRGRRWLVINAAETGDFATFDAEVAAFECLAEQLRQPIHQYWLPFWRAARALMGGDYETTERLSLQALQLGIGAQESTVMHTYGVQLFLLRMEQGRASELEPLLVQTVNAYPELPAWRVGLCLLYLELGRDGDARREFAILSQGCFRDIPRDALWVSVLCLCVEVAVALGDRDRAAVLRELLEPYRERCVVFGFALACTGSVARYLALLDDAVGRVEDADELFALAEEVNARIGAVPYLAWARYEHARLLARRNRPCDRRRARELRSEARATAETLGMVSLLRKLGA
jgi:DNA-binding SARP family transcriptional activator